MAGSRLSVVLSLMLIGLIVTNGTIFTLLGLKLGRWSSTWITPAWLITNRPLVAIAVQLTAQILGMTEVTILSTMINLGTRAKLTYGSFSLESLSFLNAICGHRVEWTLRWRRLTALFLFLAFSFVPSAVWAGAITPMLSLVEKEGRVTVPTYSQIELGIVSPGGIANDDLLNITDRGTFTYKPELLLPGIILDNMRHASSLHGGQGIQSRMDYVNYQFVGRSYGVGSSTGLRSSFDNSVQMYKYTEDGFLATSECIYNTSSFNFFNEITADPAWTLRVWNGNFILPNMNNFNHIATAGQNDYQILVVSSASTDEVASDLIKHYAFMMSPAGPSGAQYGKIHQIQCELKYVPTEFQITVNTTNNTIEVKPQRQIDDSTFTNFAEITKAFTHRIYNIGQMFSSTQWGSPMGDAFMNNINNLAIARNETIVSTNTILEAVSASMDSMLDSIILALSGAQLMILNDAVEKPAMLTSRSVVLGDRASIYAILVINSIVTIAFLVEIFRTGIWARLPLFDYTKVSDLVLASSAGGASIAKNTYITSSRHPGDIRIRLIEGDDGTDVLVPASEELDRKRSGHSISSSNFGLMNRGGYEKI